jgi:sulfur transfer complex TusBCD TusB component (DsrH family)
MQEFQLKVVPTDNNNFALELYQCAYKKAGEKKRPAAKRIGKLKGNALVLARQAIYSALKANNYDPKTLSYNRSSPYVLEEQSGVSLALLFQTLQPLSKSDRIANIANGVMAMSNEEAHYWFAKVSNGRRSNALKAIRVLLGD